MRVVYSVGVSTNHLLLILQYWDKSTFYESAKAVTFIRQIRKMIQIGSRKMAKEAVKHRCLTFAAKMPNVPAQIASKPTIRMNLNYLSDHSNSDPSC